MLVLGIETSCDETGVALYHRTAADALYSQVDIHAEYGGVVPELASRDHSKTLPLIDSVLSEPHARSRSIRPSTAGLGALTRGTTVARSIAKGLGVPALGCIMEGHLMAPMLGETRLVIRLWLYWYRGHTQLIKVARFVTMNY